MRNIWKAGATVAAIAVVATAAVSWSTVASAASGHRADDNEQGDQGGHGERDGRAKSGAVFTQSNAADGNAVVAFRRAADGSLTSAGTFPTGGTGTGRIRTPSQGSVILTDDNRFLLVANIGSDDVSVFAVHRDATLTLVDREPSNGDNPFSISVHDDLVYVLNGGVDNNISGFRLSDNGNLSPIANSTRPLSALDVKPAQVQFSPDGDTLVVTEKASNKIDTYTVGADGLATGPDVHASSGHTPFGLAFTKTGNEFVVTEAEEGIPGAASASSYSLVGGFHVVSPSVGDTQSEVCWTVISKDGRYAYITNFQSGTTSSYTVGRDGALKLLNPIAARTSDSFGPRDEDLSQDGRYLYIIDIKHPSISGFSVEKDGSLGDAGTVTGLPPFFAGLAVR